MQGFRIPKEKRHKFSQPLGRLISGNRKNTILKVESILKGYLIEGYVLNIYTVGDIVTHDFLDNSFLRQFIKLSIIDGKTQRHKIRIILEEYFDQQYQFKNPQGSISMDSFVLLNKIIKSNKRTILKIIEGEEDLLVLPLVKEIILKERIKNLVFYGQPPITDAKITIPEGIVLVDVSIEIKQEVENLINIMEKY